MDFWNLEFGAETYVHARTVAWYTNKNHLLDDHEETLKSFRPTSYPFEIRVCRSVTSDLQLTSPVLLHANNRVDIKTIIKFINQPMIGKFLLCRSICPPFKMNAVGTVVDDPEGELCVRLSLYNFINDPSSINTHLPVGTVLAIKNPWFKTTADNGLSVRCDNPDDVVKLNVSSLKTIFPDLKWNGDIPSKYKLKELAAPEDPLDWKIIGNDHFKLKRYQNAVDAYTNGLAEETLPPKDKVDMLANRSAAFLGLSNHKLALIDAESALAIDKFHLKCIYRKAMALFGMSLYGDALEFLNKMSSSELHDNKNVVNDLIIKAKSFIDQSENGDYPWQTLSKMSQNDHLDLAEYKGHVIVKNTPTKGRSLFTTKMIKAGELILASKAFAFCMDNTPNEVSMSVNIGTNRLKEKTQTQLVSKIAHILKENPEKCTELYSLYAGPALGYVNYEGVEGEDGQVCDIKRIDSICSYNSFGTPINLFGRYQGSACSGLWITPSFINHSCVDSNSSWLRIGNFLFIRAFHDIQAGQEILISYHLPVELISQRELDSYGFNCECRLCARDREDDSLMHYNRSTLLGKLDKIMEKYIGNHNTFGVQRDGIEIRRLLKQFNETRPNAPELNLCLYKTMVGICGCYYFKNKYFIESAKYLANLFKAIENIPAFSYVSIEICGNIIAGFLHGGQKSKGQTWLNILKERATLAYGTWAVIYDVLPSTVDLMKKCGLDF